MDFILALDQGTTTTTCLILDKFGNVIAEDSKGHGQSYPQPGYVEQSAESIKASVQQSIDECVSKAKIKKTQIAGIGIANQRETLCFFDEHSRGVWPFIVWQCRRSEDICHTLKNQGLEKLLHEKTGLVVDPYFTATKIKWMFEHHEPLKKHVEEKKVMLGTIDTFLAHWFSHGELYITDITNASRTMLMNLHTGEWDEECLDIFSLKKEVLPNIVSNSAVYGVTKGLAFLPDDIPICSLIGDQQSALFAQGCLEAGEAKATFGTGCFILLNTGTNLVLSNKGLLTSVAYEYEGKRNYCLEGSAFVAGAAIEFLKDSLGVIQDESELDSLLKGCHSSNGVCFVPALCGLGSPHWKPNATGLLSGLTRGTKKSHIARSVLEGIALQNQAIIGAMKKEGIELKKIKADGGCTKSDIFMQIQTDILDVPFWVAQDEQQTAKGAGFLAGLALGLYNLGEIEKNLPKPNSFQPQMDKKERLRLINAYDKAVEKI